LANNQRKMTTPNQKLESAQAKMAEAQLEINEAKRQIEEAKVVPWEPGGGDYLVGHHGTVFDFDYGDDGTQFGNSFKTAAQAEQASKRMRFYNRLCKLAMELNPSGEVGGNYYAFRSDEGGWCYGTLSSSNGPDSVFETKDVAIHACEIMNRDKWELPWK
jgi:hypothetical protein